MNLYELETHLNKALNINKFRDYGPNGLQVEGKVEVQRIVTGVTASQDLLAAAIAVQADAILVHHGYFWKNESPVIRGMKKRRLASLLQHDISLFGYHLPLDAHPQWGNNVQLAQQLGIEIEGVMDERELQGVGNIGYLPQPMSLQAFGQHLEAVLGRSPLLIEGGDHPIRRIAWCTGGAQGYFEKAILLGVDAFVTGEISEYNVHLARETGVAFYSAGHHATERYGVQALASHLATHCEVECEYIDIDNPV